MNYDNIRLKNFWTEEEWNRIYGDIYRDIK